jgi:hypothetical protein
LPSLNEERGKGARANGRKGERGEQWHGEEGEERRFCSFILSGPVQTESEGLQMALHVVFGVPLHRRCSASPASRVLETTRSAHFRLLPSIEYRLSIQRFRRSPMVVGPSSGPSRRRTDHDLRTSCSFASKCPVLIHAPTLSTPPRSPWLFSRRPVPCNKNVSIRLRRRVGTCPIGRRFPGSSLPVCVFAVPPSSASSPSSSRPAPLPRDGRERHGRRPVPARL